LSTAYRNYHGAEAFTERYALLMEHYGFTGTRNNISIAHENGVIESSNRHIKAQLEQALRIRGSYEFTSRDDYESFILIITSNQSFEDWDVLFTDTTMTVAAIDRLVHHSHIIQLKGESYRRKAAIKQEE
jgi:hypothetical protein